MGGRRVLVYPMRRDLRVADNPILHHLATTDDHGFTDILPLYVFESHLIEISGFIDTPGTESPYPAARSKLAKFWRCGPHRAGFTAESVWDLKVGLEAVGSGLVIRVGKTVDVLRHIFSHVGSGEGDDVRIAAVWMTEEATTEEIAVQNEVASLCTENNLEFRLWADEKYLIDDRDTGLQSFGDVPNIFTGYRKSQEPLREKPRATLPRPAPGSLPNLLDPSITPKQSDPFVSAESLEEMKARLLKPLQNILHDPPPWPEGIETSHPFLGGESAAWERLLHLVKSSFFWTYQQTRNGLAGVDFSTKLSAYLALGSITARQIHHELVALEDGTNDEYKEVRGFGRGQSVGTTSMRFELLWRDYMRLCALKFGPNLFRVEGYHDKDYNKPWLAPMDAIGPNVRPTEGIDDALKRLLEGTTGLGFVDASQRELYNTGYTSNRARQNVASFITKHLDIDWRYGAEWYESLLVDYDVASNWGNWQYVAGVGNDPRGDARVFNPVKQSFEYDKDGSYTKQWMPELRPLQSLENVFQAWTASPDALAAAGLTDNIMVTKPLKHVIFNVERRVGQAHHPRHRSPDSEILSDAPDDDDQHGDGQVDGQGRPRGGRRSSRGGNGRGGRGGYGGYGGRGNGNGNGGGSRGGNGAAGGDRGRGGHAGHAANGHQGNGQVNGVNGHQSNGYQNGFMTGFANGGRGGGTIRGGRSDNRGGVRNGRGGHGVPGSRARSDPWRDNMNPESAGNGGGANGWTNSHGHSPQGMARPLNSNNNNGNNHSAWRGPNRGGSSNSHWRGGSGANRSGRQPPPPWARAPNQQRQSQSQGPYPANQFSGFPPNGGYDFNSPVGMNPFMQQPMGQAFDAFSPTAQGFPMAWGGFGQWPAVGGFMEQQQQAVGLQQGQQGQQGQQPAFWAMPAINQGPVYPGGQ